MNRSAKATKVAEGVYWVGAIDWAIRDFHGYQTSRGSTYNAYLVLADKITLIDTVKAPFKDDMLSRVASVVDPGDISYIVSNHSEMDHSGCLPEVIEAVRPEKVFASQMGVKTLAAHFHGGHEIAAVKDGETLSLGNRSLTFLESRMLHWPDSMVTYMPDAGVLFSQDAFGMHLASGERFADEIDDAILEWESTRYFANILLPFSPLITKFLQKVAELGITIDVAATDHGPIWRGDDVAKIVGWYSQWAAQKPTNKAVVVYDTMWGSTASMASAIAEGLMAGGGCVEVMQLGACHRSDVAAELLDAGALLVGSPTLNSNMFPTVADVLTYLKGLKPQNLIGAAFGSYGWGSKVAEELTEVLDAMKVELVGEPIKVRYVPDEEALAECHALGARVAERLKALSRGATR
ncbi:MAG: flavodoxin domain-containing protein [Armatimonadota bacterium]|jgi:flavorubredoxin